MVAVSLLDGETVLLATHLISEADHFINRPVILEKGKTKRDRLIDEMRTAGRMRENLMRRFGGNDRERYCRILGREGVE